MSNYLSYKQIFQDRIKFRQAGGPNGSDFNNYDFPGAKYFRILFHFYNSPGTIDSNMLGSGLLHPTWQSPAWVDGWGPQKVGKANRADEYVPWRFNTAYSYLITNDEQERAQYLKHFISLLSNINSESPWYFKSIKGIEEGLNRKQFTETFEFKERGRLVIECMPDAFDERISTLLDLYRAATYSWVNKREIIPANLRKFDMSVIVFQVPIQGMHIPDGVTPEGPSNILGQLSNLLNEDDTNFATLDWSQSGPLQASYKIYEFHNCEFDYNSTTAAGDSLINEEPFNTTYNIAIWYDDMYETRYNQFMKMEPVNIATVSRSAKSAGTSFQQEYNDKVAAARKTLQDTAPIVGSNAAKIEQLEAKIKETQEAINLLKTQMANKRNSGNG